MTKPNGIYDGITPEKTDQMYVDLGICLDCGCQVQSDKCCKNKQDGNPLSTYGKQLIADAKKIGAEMKKSAEIVRWYIDSGTYLEDVDYADEAQTIASLI